MQKQWKIVDFHRGEKRVGGQDEGKNYGPYRKDGPPPAPLTHSVWIQLKAGESATGYFVPKVVLVGAYLHTFLCLNLYTFPACNA